MRPDAIFLVAWYAERHAAKPDVSRVRKLYELAAEQEFPLAEAWCKRQRLHAYAHHDPLTIYENTALDDNSLCEGLCRPFLLGEAHEQGLFGLQRDPSLAAACFHIAAERGLIDAEQRLALMHLNNASDATASCLTSDSS